MSETIAALSSGLVPSGVAVVRVSGPRTRFVLETISGAVPEPRYAALRTFRDVDGQALDKGLVLYFPKPNSFTGEEVAEFHCHGGPAVVAGLLDAIIDLEDVQAAEPGGFTLQAFRNGKLDLAQVEAVGDLVAASTKAQRAQALDQLGGAASNRISAWAEKLIMIRALIEADLDFSDEEDVNGSVLDSVPERLERVRNEMAQELESGFAERVRDGFSVVIAGAPNAGKSTLLNALIGREAALVSEIPGTTRDRIDVAVDCDGLPVVLSDVAGLRDTDDVVERMGVERARQSLDHADLILWLDPEGRFADGDFDEAKTIRVRSKADLRSNGGGLAVSAQLGDGIDALKRAVGVGLRESYEGFEGVVVLDARRREALMDARQAIDEALGVLEHEAPIELAAEHVRAASDALGHITGRVGSEAVLGAIFSRFCIGK